MAAPGYRIVTNGRPLKGHSPEEVLRNLSALFKTPLEKTRPLLMGNIMVVRKGLDEPAARQMLAALRKAGLACKAEPEGEQGSHAASGGAVVKPAAAVHAGAGPPDVRAAMGAPAIDPEMGGIAIQYTATQAGTIAPSERGLDMGRPGARDVPFADVLLMSVYEIPSALGGEARLMVFTAGSRRPYVVKASSIKYHLFGGIATSSAALSLRQFIAYVYARTPSLVLDAPTVKFLGGALPRQMKLDESILATALGRSLEARGSFREALPAASQAGPDVSQVIRNLRASTAPDPAASARLRARLAMAFVAVSMAHLAWVLLGQMRFFGSFMTFFFRGVHPVLNHLIMWPAVLVIIALMVHGAFVLGLLRSRGQRAQDAFATYAWAFGIYSVLRFAALAALALGLRHGFIRGSFALFELRDVIGSRHYLLKALLISPAAFAIPMAAAMIYLFSRSWQVRSTFGEQEPSPQAGAPPSRGR